LLRFAHYLAQSPQNKMTHQQLRSSRSHFANHALVLSRFSSGLFRAMFAMKEIKNGKEIHRRV
jgi:hypothetical protein